MEDSWHEIFICTQFLLPAMPFRHLKLLQKFVQLFQQWHNHGMKIHLHRLSTSSYAVSTPRVASEKSCRSFSDGQIHGMKIHLRNFYFQL